MITVTLNTNVSVIRNGDYSYNQTSTSKASSDDGAYA